MTIMEQSVIRFTRQLPMPIEGGKSTGYDYTRLQNPTREHLEKTVVSLENGIDAVALSTGMAAIILMMELFEPGDHLIVDSDLYGGSIRLFQNVSKKNKISFTSIDCYRENVETYINEKTRAVYIETPTNPMMNVTDIAELAKITKKHRILLIVDNTFLSPYFQNPLELDEGAAWMGTTGKVVGQDSGRSLCTGNGSQSLYAAG